VPTTSGWWSLAVVACGLVATAQAEDLADRATPTPEEVGAVERCVLAAPDVAGRRMCVGVVSAPCQGTPDGATTLGSNACLGREYRAWDGLLNRYYREAVDAFDDDGRSYLRSTQRAWLAFRDQACGWPYKAYPGGTIAGPLAVECLMTQTALRALDLLDLRTVLRQR
jgi:uncharacterized protein YecT (DUF1311 family)